MFCYMVRPMQVSRLSSSNDDLAEIVVHEIAAD